MQDYNTLMYDGLKANNIQAIRLAIANGANINKASKPSEEDIIPLYHACDIQNFELIQILVEAGCDVNVDNPKEDGMTPLICACQKGNIDIIKFLLDSGADIDLGCDGDKTPLLNACALKHIDVIRLLIERGADVNKLDIFGVNPLSLSIDNDNIEIIKILLSEPTININQNEDIGDFYVVHLINAIESKNIDILELLINAGADVNIVDRYGDTPLKYAIREYNIEMAQILLLNGANIPNDIHYENIYDDEVVELLKMWPGLMILYGLDYSGFLKYIDLESICMLNGMLNDMLT